MTPAPHGSGPEANLRHTGAQMTKNVYSFNGIRSKEKDLFLLFHPSSPLSSTLLMGPLCHLLVYSVLSRYPPGSLPLYYLVRNSALCVVCVQPLSGLLYCKKELMCNWRPKVWTLRSSSDLYLLLLWMSSAFYHALLRITCSVAEPSALVAHIIAHHRCPDHTAIQLSRLVIVKTRGGCERRWV